jgi:hypothetical protein
VFPRQPQSLFSIGGRAHRVEVRLRLQQNCQRFAQNRMIVRNHDGNPVPRNHQLRCGAGQPWGRRHAGEEGEEL